MACGVVMQAGSITKKLANVIGRIKAVLFWLVSSDDGPPTGIPGPVTLEVAPLRAASPYLRNDQSGRHSQHV